MSGSTCEVCGGELNVGDWPFCDGDPTAHVPALHFGDEPIAPYFDEMISPEGAEIRTRGDRRRLMRENHLEFTDLSNKKRGKIFIDLGR